MSNPVDESPAAAVERRRRGAWLAALPEAVLAALFVFAWCAPTRLDPDLVRTLFLTLTVEFMAVPAATLIGFAGGFLATGKRAVRWLAIPLVLFGLGFFAENASVVVKHGGAWLYAGCAVLLAGKVGKVFSFRNRALAARAILVEAFLSIVMLIVLVFASALLPFPALGFDAEALATLALPGEGLWHEHPERLFAISAIYFGAMVFVRRLVTVSPWEAHAEPEGSAKAQGQAGSSVAP